MSSSSDTEEEELTSSKLGTKNYWDKAYAREIENYKNHGDIGEIWFDEDSQFRVIKWMLKNDIKSNDTIIDLGCGNGMMLIELAREGFHNLTGIDYSSHAIELAKNVAKDQDINITYKVFDLLINSNELLNQLGKFHVVHDKGTYDAISLHPDNSKEKRMTYIDNLYKITENDGLMIITSCNWTESELENAFKCKFVKHSVIPTPSFKFGGHVGNVVTSIVFKKVLL